MINLQDFVAPGRSFIAHPFSIGEWTSAPHGIMAVRGPRRDDIGEAPEAPVMGKVWPKEWPAVWSPIKPIELPAPETVPCDSCGGRGTLHNCPACTCLCEHCDGSGSIEFLNAVKVGDQRISLKLARKLLLLPNVKIALWMHLLCIVFDGGEAIGATIRESATLEPVAEL